MRMNKPIALLLSSVLMVSTVTACNTKPELESAQSDPDSTTVQETQETTPADEEYDLTGYKELPVADVSDEDDGKLVIFGYNSEFVKLAEKYAGISEDDYEFVEITDADDYKAKLDEVLASGEGAPDIFICDAAYAKKYVNSEYTLPVNDIGIGYDECSEMFDYNLRYAADDEDVIKALAWKATPCGVFYVRSLADQYLGTSEPDALAASFADWNAVKASAVKVNDSSEHSVKLFAGITEPYNAYLASRSNSGWIKDGAVSYDPKVIEYLDFAKALRSEDLTFGAEPWSGPWKTKMSDKSVVSYWGSLQFAKHQLGLNPGQGMSINPTSGDWGLTSAPVGYCDGGSWVMVSKYCDKKETAAKIIRAVCTDEDNLEDMVNNGEFVNNIKLMTLASEDDKFAVEWLGGQNPYKVLLDSALKADASLIVTDEDRYDREFKSIAGAYSEGAFENTDAAKAAFEDKFKAEEPEE